MNLLLGPFLRKLTYSTQSRRFAEKRNPAAKARIWPQIGVLQLALLINDLFLGIKGDGLPLLERAESPVSANDNGDI